MNREDVLSKQIEKHNKLYWEDGEPVISDIDYDRLVFELKLINPQHKLLNKIYSPTVESTGKVKHFSKMLSLEKETSVSKIIKWCEKKSRSPHERFVLQPKYDGCSIEINKGIMSTRGNGIVGEDITNKMKICNIEIKNKKIDLKDINYIRGEILFKKNDFIEYNKLINNKYKTPRNAVGGLLNTDDIGDVGKILTIVPFDEYQVEFELINITEDIINQYMKDVLNSEYPCDGIVIKLADINYRQDLGSSSTNNRWEISLKFANPMGESVLRKIEWCMGKHRITPRAHIDPVEIGGVIVSHINLHNFKYLIDNDICIGDLLTVERAGDVIPDFKSLVPGKERIKPEILHCPSCNEPVEYIEPEIVCTSKDCNGKHLMKLMDSIIRIGIEKLGKPTLEKILDKFTHVNNLVDILNLKKEDFLQLDGFAESSSVNIFEEIQQAKQNVTEWKILSSLNIKGIGTRLSKELLSNRNLNDLRKMNVDDLISIKGVGKERANLLVKNLLDESEYIDSLINNVNIVIESEEMDNGIMSICFTGKMPEKRSYYEKLAVDNGYIIGSSNKNLNILVCVDPDSNSSKLKNARKFGTKVISVEEFLCLIQKNS